MPSQSFVLQEKTLGGLLDEIVALNPDRDAVVYYERRFRQTWAELGRDADRLAKGLLALGVQKGEKLGIWSTNVPHWLTMMFASAKIGAVLITINTNYQTHELKYALLQSDCETLVLGGSHRDDEFLQTLEHAVPAIRERSNGSVRSEELPALKRLIHMGEEPPEGMPSVYQIMAMGDGVPEAEYAARVAEVHPHDVVNMQYTSGTTGFPKAVMLSHVNILNNAYWVGKNQNFSPADKVCLPVPLYHCFGCTTGMMAFVSHGTSVVVIEAFNPLKVMAAVQEERCTGLYGVPTMYLSIMEHKHFSRYDLSSLRTGIMAGSVCPVALMKRAMKDMYLREITICYGFTEGSPVITQTTYEDGLEAKTTTVGKPLPGIEVRVVHPETRQEAPLGVDGEVACRGYNVMKGYYNMPEATAQVIDQDGWLYTGDIGHMREDGYLLITGRIKDMIIRGGENLYPSEIEEFLAGMEGIFDVQVVGVPSHKYGEEVAAFIIPREGAEITPKTIRDFCRGRIAWSKIPRFVHLMEEFPLTGSGKVQKFKLREMAAALFPDARLAAASSREPAPAAEGVIRPLENRPLAQRETWKPVASRVS